MIFRVKGSDKSINKEHPIKGTIKKEEKEVEFKKKKETKEIEANGRNINREEIPEETKELIPEYFEEYSFLEAEDKVDIPLQPNDEDYEPPQWFRQQTKKDSKIKNNEETKNRNTDINISDEFDKESQIEKSSFQHYFTLMKDLQYLNKENLSELYKNEINFVARIVDFSKGKQRGQTI